MLFSEDDSDLPYYNRLYDNLLRVQAIFLVLGWFLILLFLYKLWKTIIHLNFRIMFAIVSLQYYLASSIRLCLKLFIAYVQEPKWLVYGVATIANVLHVLALHLGILTVLFIACERLCATILPNGYEHRNAKISCTLLTIELIIGLVISIAAEIYKQNDPEVLCAQCSLYEAIPITFFHGWIESTACCIFGCIIISVLYCYNRHQRRDYANALSSRFQYQENILATKSLLPIVYGYILVDCFGLPTASLIPRMLERFKPNDVRIQIVLQICFLLIDFYNYTSIIAVMIVFRPIRISLIDDLQRFCCFKKAVSRRPSSQYEFQAKEQQAHLDFELHFKQLCQAWETKRLNRIAQTKY